MKLIIIGVIAICLCEIKAYAAEEYQVVDGKIIVVKTTEVDAKTKEALIQEIDSKIANINLNIASLEEHINKYNEEIVTLEEQKQKINLLQIGE